MMGGCGREAGVGAKGELEKRLMLRKFEGEEAAAALDVDIMWIHDGLK